MPKQICKRNLTIEELNSELGETCDCELCGLYAVFSKRCDILRFSYNDSKASCFRYINHIERLEMINEQLQKENEELKKQVLRKY